MTDLFSLIDLLELTRNQPQYGYALARIPKGEQSDLAQHHYLVAMIAWQLADTAKRAGGAVDLERVLQLSLVHDLGELFGGDIAAPYARVNPAARQAAKAFEAENQRFLAGLFTDQSAHIQSLFDEERSAQSDEAQIVKMADFIECTHYKRLVGRMSDGDVTLAKNVCEKRLSLLQDATTKRELDRVIQEWLASFGQADHELFESAKHKNNE